MIKSGSIGELAVAKHFLQNGYEVYTSVSDDAMYDLLLVKNSTIFRVEVKSTSSKRNGKYVVQVKSVRSNRTGSRIIPFDNTKVDFLAVYIIPEDKVIIMKASDVTQKSEIVLDI